MSDIKAKAAAKLIVENPHGYTEHSVHVAKAYLELQKANEWTKCSDGLPKASREFGCTEFSDYVLVDNGLCFSVDCVMYPHGLYGHDTTPQFVDSKANEPVIRWKPIQKPKARR